MTQDNNMIQAFPQVPTTAECHILCEDNSDCNAYTYFEESNVLSNLCLLFNSCDSLDEECEGCVTGVIDCDTCSYDDTVDGQCVSTNTTTSTAASTTTSITTGTTTSTTTHTTIGTTIGTTTITTTSTTSTTTTTTTTTSTCANGSDESFFGGHCYKLLDNSGQHYSDRAVCTRDCAEAGGLLTSVHSTEENSFIYSLLRPLKSGNDEQNAWIGADLVGGNSFKWTDGTAFDYTNWLPGEPDGHDCVYLGFSQIAPEKWQNSECNSLPIFDCVCKKQILSSDCCI